MKYEPSMFIRIYDHTSAIINYFDVGSVHLDTNNVINLIKKYLLARLYGQ